MEKYFSEKYLKLYFQTKTRSVVSTCIDYLNGLISLPYRKNMKKMAIYCCKWSNNQSLRGHLKILSLPYRKNMKKMAIYCCKWFNNQSLRSYLKILSLPYRKNMKKMVIYCCKWSNNQSLRSYLKIRDFLLFSGLQILL